MTARVTFFQLQDFRPKSTDWAKIIAELAAASIPARLIADALCVSRDSVLYWKNEGGQPRHDHGVALLAMHARFCKKTPGANPG